MNGYLESWDGETMASRERGRAEKNERGARNHDGHVVWVQRSGGRLCCCLYSDLVPPRVLTNSSGLGTPAPDAIGEPIAALAASSNSSSDAEAWGAIVQFCRIWDRTLKTAEN